MRLDANTVQSQFVGPQLASVRNSLSPTNRFFRLAVVMALMSPLSAGGQQPSGPLIYTVAGDGAGGYSGDGGAATGAELLDPYGVATNSTGTLYIADTVNSVIRMVSSATGVITTVAGSGTGCAGQIDLLGDGCPATSAQLSSPHGVAVDSVGDLYIADTYNSVIRMVSVATGVITTIAGNGTIGYSGDGGPASSAELSAPLGVALDSAGNLYIADTGNQVIRKVSASTGVITTIAGNGAVGYSGDGGPATSAKLYQPTSVALDGSGNLYIAVPGNAAIRMVSASTGVITTVAGDGLSVYTGDGGPATSAGIGAPQGVAVDSAGNFYISDFIFRVIRKVSATTGVITTIAGNGQCCYGGDGGPATSAEFTDPSGLAVNSAGNLFIADPTNCRIRLVELGPSAVLLDPVTQLLVGGAVINPNDSSGANILANSGRVVTGIAADGISQVVVRISGISVGEQLTLTLYNDANAISQSSSADGALGSPGGSAPSSNSVTVTGVSTSQGPMAFAVYLAPIDFPRSTSQDQSSQSRSVSIQIQPAGGAAVQLPVTILRPPVVLVHGIWSSAVDTWGKFCPFYTTCTPQDSRFAVATVDYSQIANLQDLLNANDDATVWEPILANALGFQYNAPSVLSQLLAEIGSFRYGANPLGIQVADVQADVVAHSMGGVIIRTLAAPPIPSGSYTFYSNDNFGAGDIHKLITIDTPHLGTPVATQLLASSNQCVANMLTSFGESVISSQVIDGAIVSGAVNDLSGDGHGGSLSAALSALQTQGSAKLIPTGTIAAEESSINWDSLGSVGLNLSYLAPIWCRSSSAPLLQFMTPQTWQAIFSYPPPFVSPGDDALVPVVSQLNGLVSTNSIVFPNLIHSPGTVYLGFTGPSVLDDGSNLVPNEVITILNTPITDSSAFNSFTP